MPVVRGFSDTIIPLSVPVLVVPVGNYCPVFRLPFNLFSDLSCFIAENVLSHEYMFPNIECIFNAKSFSLGNLSLLTNFQKLSTVSNTVSVGYIFTERFCACSN